MRTQDTLTDLSGTSVLATVTQARKGFAEPLARLMRDNNRRLFRIARGILRDDAEAEDIVQDAFVKAFTNAADLRDDAKLSSWLAIITVNLARDRLRQIARNSKVFDFSGFSDQTEFPDASPDASNSSLSPERLAAMGDVRKVLEREIDRLPDGFREVFILRVIEQMSVAETAEVLALRSATVKTRLHRARTTLRENLETQFTAESLNAFPFGGVRCARTTEAVIKRLTAEVGSTASNTHH